MEETPAERIAVQALRLGVAARNLLRLQMPVTLQAETLVLKSAGSDPAPLILCLHPGRLCEFQCAQRLRDLVQLDAHIAFPRGLYPGEVDLGGARTVGYGWYQDTGDNPAFRRGLQAAADYLERVLGRLLEELPVREGAVYLVGVEESSLVAVVLAMRRPERIAGVVLIDGDLPATVLADWAPPVRRTRFLRIHRSMRRPPGAPPTDTAAEQLRALGYPVEVEMLRTRDTRWAEESGALLSWLSQRAGLTLRCAR